MSAAHRTMTRLRWVLTLSFTLTSAVALLLFAYLVVRADAERGRQELDGRLKPVTLAAIQLIDQSDGEVSLANFARSGLADQCPGFVVLPGSSRAFLGLQSRSDCAMARLSVLNRAATEATRTGRITIVTASAQGNGHEVRILAEPFYLVPGQPAGAVVAVTDAQPTQDRHQRVLLFATIGSALLILGLGVVGHVVSGRAMRPAGKALAQQELFLAEAAHDLRTPVAALRALAEAAVDNPAERGVLLPRTVALAKRMGTIIEDLLVRARLAAGVAELNRQPVRLDQLVVGVVDELPSAGASITVNAHPCTVSADAPLLQRAVGNLLDNALKYGHFPGQPAVVTVAVFDGVVQVADRGPGLGPAAPRARASGSAGLGLSIVRWVAETHDGDLRSGDARGGGAVFELVLPVI